MRHHMKRLEVVGRHWVGRDVTAFVPSPKPPLGRSVSEPVILVNTRCSDASSVPSQTLHLHHNWRLLAALLDLNSSNRTPAMRYDDWDVILFPKDSHVPIQEFKTACYVSPEECELRLYNILDVHTIDQRTSY